MTLRSYTPPSSGSTCSSMEVSQPISSRKTRHAGFSQHQRKETYSGKRPTFTKPHMKGTPHHTVRLRGRPDQSNYRRSSTTQRPNKICGQLPQFNTFQHTNGRYGQRLQLTTMQCNSSTTHRGRRITWRRHTRQLGTASTLPRARIGSTPRLGAGGSTTSQLVGAGACTQAVGPGTGIDNEATLHLCYH